MEQIPALATTALPKPSTGEMPSDFGASPHPARRSSPIEPPWNPGQQICGPIRILDTAAQTSPDQIANLLFIGRHSFAVQQCMHPAMSQVQPLTDLAQRDRTVVLADLEQVGNKLLMFLG